MNPAKNPTKKFALGIDIGATTIKAGIVDRKGNVLHQTSTDTKSDRGPAMVMQQVFFVIKDLLGRFRVSECMGIGVGTPGVVSSENGVVQHPPNFTNWTEFDVAKAIRKVYALPVFIENDANTAALGEGIFGSAKNLKDFLFVIWGTGVGGGIIFDKKVFRGPFGGAGEIGHVSIDYNGRKCNCGNKGCIEAYIGQRYLSERTKHILESADKDGFPSKILTLVEGNFSRIEPSIITEAAELGDQTALEILEEAGQLLGFALASVLNVLDLRTVVIGGGISAAPKFVYEQIEASIKSRVLKPHRGGIQVIRASLGNNAGIVGAASLVM